MSVRYFTGKGLGLLLCCFTASAGIYMAGQYFNGIIADNQHRAILEVSGRLLPLAHDNDLPADRISVTLPTYSGAQLSSEVYRARQRGAPVGLIFSPVVARGYNGPIELGLGLGYDGSIAGLMILQHRETAGLGDQIHQDNSSWLSGLVGHSLHNPDAWALQQDGGAIDGISGATVSQRAVLRAIERALTYYRLNQDKLFDPEP